MMVIRFFNLTLQTLQPNTNYQEVFMKQITIL